MGNFANALEALKPDLFLVNSYSMILGAPLLSLPRHGAINVHGALLPAYRGANPMEWALINGERETGVTVHLIDPGIDTGPIIGQARVPIAFEDTWLDARRRVRAATETLLRELLPAILAGGIPAHRQGGGSRHWKRRTAEDGAFDWSKSAVSIYNLIRALVTPHPGAVSPDGRTFLEWQSLPAVVWMKYGTGNRRWTDARWRLSPRRPRPQPSRKAANAYLDVRVTPLHGMPIGVCRISGLGRDEPAVVRLACAPRARISVGLRAEIHETLARFAASELEQDVVFV
jgi:hypothetical protein